MKHVRIFYRMLPALLTCVILALGGCGKGSSLDQKPGSGDDIVSELKEQMAYKDMRYLPEFTDTTNTYGVMGSTGLGFVNDTFYLLERRSGNAGGFYSISGGRIVAYHPEDGKETVLWDEEGKEERIVTAAPLADGSVLILLSMREGGYRYCKLDAGGNESFSAEHPSESIESGGGNDESFLRFKMAADFQGRGYLLAEGKIVLFDEQGEISGKIDLGQKRVRNIVCAGDGKVYILESMSSELILLDFEKSSLGTSSYRPLKYVQNVAGTAGAADILVCDGTTVYRYGFEEKNLNPLFDLSDSLIADASCIDMIGELSDGRMFLFLRDERQSKSETALLTPKPLSECTDMKVVTLGVIFPYSSLIEDVAAFNRSNEDFSISIVNYMIGERTFAEAVEALKLDISVGKGPDMYDLSRLDELEPLFAAGCFTDLSDYLESSRQYKREDFIEQAMDVFTYQDQLFAIPKYFQLYTIVGSADVVGQKMGWNLEDIKEIVEKYPDAMIFESVPSSHMLEACARNMFDTFVDLDKKKANFDSAEYIEFLDFLKNLPDNFCEKEENEYQTNGDLWLQEKKALLSYRSIQKMSDLQFLRAVFGGSYTCIGYPSPDRTPDCIISGQNAYAVSVNSANKDRAWKFIEWLHLTQGEERYDEFLQEGFPTRKDVFEEKMEQAVRESRGGAQTLSDGETWVNFHESTPEEVELIRSLIACAKPDKSAEQAILDIMVEEASYLFGGGKSAEEVAEVTQNRVQLYLDEK